MNSEIDSGLNIGSDFQIYMGLVAERLQISCCDGCGLQSSFMTSCTGCAGF